MLYSTQQLFSFWHFILTDIILFKQWVLTKNYMFFNHAVISTHYTRICAFVLTALKVAKTCWWLLCNNIAVIHSHAFLGLLKKNLYICLKQETQNIWNSFFSYKQQKTVRMLSMLLLTINILHRNIRLLLLLVLFGYIILRLKQQI